MRRRVSIRARSSRPGKPERGVISVVPLGSLRSGLKDPPIVERRRAGLSGDVTELMWRVPQRHLDFRNDCPTEDDVRHPAPTPGAAPVLVSARVMHRREEGRPVERVGRERRRTPRPVEAESRPRTRCALVSDPQGTQLTSHPPTRHRDVRVRASWRRPRESVTTNCRRAARSRQRMTYLEVSYAPHCTTSPRSQAEHHWRARDVTGDQRRQRCGDVTG